MSQNNRDSDDLLNFKYDNPVPQNKSSESQGLSEEVRLYEQLRAESKSRSSAGTSSGRSSKSRQSESRKKADERAIAAARKNAQQNAYDNYRNKYSGKKRKSGSKKGDSGAKGTTGKWDKIISVLYVIALTVFVGSMLILDVLPARMLIALLIVLALLSIILLVQLRKKKIQKWAKRLAEVTGVLLIIFFCVGSSYALGTMSFLSSTTVENDSKVADITKDPFNIVITGLDVDGTIDEEGRSDVNMVVTVNPVTHQILLTSIPRDYEVYLQDYDSQMDKLTHTGFYGVNTTILAEENLLGIEANYYVKVNFTTVEKFVDAVGGIDVYSEYSFTPVKLKSWTVQEGENHMNGEQALAFARERKAFTSGDNQRVKNQQAVFEAMIEKATSSMTMVLKYDNVIADLQDYIEMSISSKELRQLVKMQISDNPDWEISKNSLTGGDDNLYTYTAGYAYVMTQDSLSIDYAKWLINAVLDGKTLTTDSEGLASVEGEEYVAYAGYTEE